MRVIFHGNFRKKFGKLSVAIQEKFRERLTFFLRNTRDPILNNHSVGKAFPGCRSINVTGDYRAIFREEGEAVIFITIGTHADLYD